MTIYTKKEAETDIINSPFSDALGWTRRGNLTQAGRDVVNKVGKDIKKYVVTSGRRINLVLHRGDFSTIAKATKKAKKLKKEGKTYVAIKSKTEYGLSHERYV